MSWHVDDDSLLFDELNANEAWELEKLVRGLMEHKQYSTHAAFTTWAETFGITGKRQTTAPVLSVFLSYALLSIVTILRRKRLNGAEQDG
jgi:hypothetical protein